MTICNRNKGGESGDTEEKEYNWRRVTNVQKLAFVECANCQQQLDLLNVCFLHCSQSIFFDL